MTSSFRKIDYRLRPAKHAERAMFVDLIRKLRFHNTEDYQYIGMGSVGFIDHRLMHRHAGISRMVSFEDNDDPNIQDRFKKNLPLSCVTMTFGASTAILPTLDFTRPSVAWLDYDNTLHRSMVNDLATIGRTIADGSFVAVTFSTSVPQADRTRGDELARLKKEFPEYVAETEKLSSLEPKWVGDLGRKAFGDLLSRSLSDADAIKPESQKRLAKQVCYFRYNDGAPMCTLGWVIVSSLSGDRFDQSNLQTLSFYRNGADPFSIKIPKVTPFEIREMERRLPNIENNAELSWIPSSDRAAFEAIYRYLPTFGVFEPI